MNNHESAQGGEMAARGQAACAWNMSRATCTAQNVGSQERVISAIAGTALAMRGLAVGRAGGLLLGGIGAALIYRGLTGNCQLYQMLGLNSAKHPAATAVPAQQGVKIEHEIVVNRSPEVLYSFWRDLRNLPKVMKHLQRVEVIDDKRSRWSARGPLGSQVEWEAEIINERRPDLIAWRSLPGGDIETAGSVHFWPTEDGKSTRVVISLKYNPPAGKVGNAIASVLGAGLEERLQQDLPTFKDMMEAMDTDKREHATAGSSGKS